MACGVWGRSHADWHWRGMVGGVLGALCVHVHLQAGWVGGWTIATQKTGSLEEGGALVVVIVLGCSGGEGLLVWSRTLTAPTWERRGEGACDTPRLQAPGCDHHLLSRLQC